MEKTPTGQRKHPGGARARLARIWRDERPAVAIPRDLGLVAFILILVLAGLWAYTGQPFPATAPLVVIESGSMMHPDSPYGHVGTIDPGDLVLVKRAGPGDIETAYGDGDRHGYGGKGDVIVYKPHGRDDRTPIIHRAMTWVDVAEVGRDANGSPIYRYNYHDESGTFLTGEASVSLPSIGISNMHPSRSGFVTKGDNPATNAIADQIGHVPGALVEPSWIVGKARGEIPWIGLVKLALGGNPAPSSTEGQCNVLAAWAPCDMWVLLGVSFAVLVAVPVGLDRLFRKNETFRRWLS